MDLATLKAFFQTKIGSKTAAGSIYPVDITDCLDALADAVDTGDIGGGGAVAPLVSSATCPNGAASTVVVVFNQSMTAVTTAGWSFKKNGSAWSVSSVSGSGTTWTFTMGSSAINGDTLLRSYDSGTGATIGTSLELVSFTDSAVTNSVSSAYDADAQAFFDEVELTDTLTTLEKDEVDLLVTSIKAETGLWAKMKVLRPLVGGTETAQVINLKNPATHLAVLEGAGTLPTIDADGYTTVQDGRAYLVTGLTGANFTDASMGFGAYIRNNAQGGSDRYVMGVVGENFYAMGFYPRDTSNEAHAVLTSSGANIVGTSVTDSTGMWIVSRTANNVGKMFKNGSQIGSTYTSTGNDMPTVRQCAEGGDMENVIKVPAWSYGFFFWSDGLSDAEVTALTTIINTFCTNLGR